MRNFIDRVFFYFGYIPKKQAYIWRSGAERCNQLEVDNVILQKQVLKSSDIDNMSLDLARELWFVYLSNMNKLRPKLHVEYLDEPEEPVEEEN